jgi:hypothetical protein
MYEVSVVVYRFVDCSCVRLSVRAIHANSAYMDAACMYCGSAACEAYLFDTGLQLYPFATRLQLYPTVTLRNTELRCIFSRLEREGARPRSDMAHPPAAGRVSTSYLGLRSEGRWRQPKGGKGRARGR